jgi:hypothetical protein
MIARKQCQGERVKASQLAARRGQHNNKPGKERLCDADDDKSKCGEHPLRYPIHEIIDVASQFYTRTRD